MNMFKIQLEVSNEEKGDQKNQDEKSSLEPIK